MSGKQVWKMCWIKSSGLLEGQGTVHSQTEHLARGYLQPPGTSGGDQMGDLKGLVKEPGVCFLLIITKLPPS